MQSNFDFLSKYWSTLAKIGSTAESYLYNDPNACIYKIGMFAERLVKEIFAFEQLQEPDFDNSHSNRINILKNVADIIIEIKYILLQNLSKI